MIDLARATLDDLATVFGPGAGYYAAGTAHTTTWNTLSPADRQTLSRFGVTPETAPTPPAALASDLDFYVFDIGPLAACWRHARHRPIAAPTLAAALAAHTAVSGDTWSVGDLLAGGLFVAWPPALDAGRWAWSDLYLVPPPVPVDRLRWPLVVPGGAGFPLMSHRDAWLGVALLRTSFDLVQEQVVPWPADLPSLPVPLDTLRDGGIAALLDQFAAVALSATRTLRDRLQLPDDLPPLCPPIPWDRVLPDWHTLLETARMRFPDVFAEADAVLAAALPDVLAAGGTLYVAPGFADLARAGWWA